MLRDPEEWEKITPHALIPAIKHIRKMFDESAWKCDELTQKLCYEALHPGQTDQDVLAPYIANFVIYRAILGRAAQGQFDRWLRAGNPPAVFHAFLDAFCNGLKTEVRRLFNDVLQIGLSNSEAITIHPVEWAKFHLGSLIDHNSHLVGLWIKSACDNQATWKPIDAEEAPDDWIYWTTWRAPRLVHMKPPGNTRFDPVLAWVREDKPKTESVLNALTERFVMSLRFALDKVAGEAHVQCAKKSDAKIQPKQPPLQNEVPAWVPETESTIVATNFSHGQRDGAVTVPDIWRDFRNQFEALAREERERRAGQSDRFLRAYCNYQDHPEVLEKGKPEQGLVCLIAKPEYGIWMLSDGLDENFRERFDVLATRAGIALGSPRSETALDYWLHGLYRNLLENKGSGLLAADEEGGMILRVCEASATYCSRLERNALETSPPAKFQITSIDEVDPKDHTTEPFTHSPDYRSVKHLGTPYSLTQQQAEAIKVLHEAYMGGNSELSGAFILEKIESPKSSRLRDVFRSSRQAWSALIRQPRRGSYRLNL